MRMPCGTFCLATCRRRWVRRAALASFTADPARFASDAEEKAVFPAVLRAAETSASPVGLDIGEEYGMPVAAPPPLLGQRNTTSLLPTAACVPNRNTGTTTTLVRRGGAPNALAKDHQIFAVQF